MKEMKQRKEIRKERQFVEGNERRLIFLLLCLLVPVPVLAASLPLSLDSHLAYHSFPLELPPLTLPPSFALKQNRKKTKKSMAGGTRPAPAPLPSSLVPVSPGHSRRMIGENRREEKEENESTKRLS